MKTKPKPKPKQNLVGFGNLKVPYGLDQTKESVSLKSNHLKLPSQKGKREKENEKERRKLILWNLWDTLKETISASLESQKEKRSGRKFIQRNNGWELPKPGKRFGHPIHESNSTPKNSNPKQCSPRYIIIKLSKIKDKERI